MQDSFLILRMNKCLERVNDRHFWNPGVFSYAMIPRRHPNSRVFFFIVASIVHACIWLLVSIFYTSRRGRVIENSAVELLAKRCSVGSLRIPFGSIRGSSRLSRLTACNPDTKKSQGVLISGAKRSWGPLSAPPLRSVRQQH
jgi:hypothetical protein